MAPLRAWIEIGTSCSFSTRRWAVTVTTSAESAFGAAVFGLAALGVAGLGGAVFALLGGAAADWSGWSVDCASAPPTWAALAKTTPNAAPDSRVLRKPRQPNVLKASPLLPRAIL